MTSLCEEVCSNKQLLGNIIDIVLNNVKIVESFF
jgi:hypothetical protein